MIVGALSKVIRFNYAMLSWDLFPMQSGCISYFWRGVIGYIPALRARISHEVRFRLETLFWKDPWLNGIAPMHIWPEILWNSLQQNGFVHELAHLLSVTPFADYPMFIRSRSSFEIVTGRLGILKLGNSLGMVSSQ